MSEKNNVIVVDITERESTELNSLSKLISIRGAGNVATKNLSQKSRLWNSMLSYKNFEIKIIMTKCLLENYRVKLE